MSQNSVIYSGTPIEKASKALILIHGRGGTAADILSLREYFCDDRYFIAAPEAADNSWYPMSFNADEHLNEPKLTASIQYIIKIIDETEKHIPKSEIYLMGFSQGAILSLEISSRNATKYGGVIAFSGGLLGKTLDEKKYHGNFENTKVFIGVSDQDPFIPLSRSIESKDLIEKLGADVTLKVYPGTSHTINQDEINCVKDHIMLR